MAAYVPQLRPVGLQQPVAPLHKLSIVADIAVWPNCIDETLSQERPKLPEERREESLHSELEPCSCPSSLLGVGQG